MNDITSFLTSSSSSSAIVVRPKVYRKSIIKLPFPKPKSSPAPKTSPKSVPLTSSMSSSSDSPFSQSPPDEGSPPFSPFSANPFTSKNDHEEIFSSRDKFSDDDRKCSSCGSVLPSNAFFCNKCGSHIRSG